MTLTTGLKNKPEVNEPPHYFKRLGLNRDPFSTSPDPDYFFPTEQHQTCLAHLEIAIRLRRGASLVLGEIGTGKTTLCRRLIQNLAADTDIETYLLMGHADTDERGFHQALLSCFGIEAVDASYSIQTNRLKHLLFERGVEANKTLVLILDEAQKLNPEAIEALRGLLNYETNDHKLLQLVLFGQLELKPILKGLPNFVDRLNFKYHLQPLTLDECGQLIRYRLRQAGYRKRRPLFSEDALALLHEYTGGYPRKICLLAHQALERLIIQREKIVHSLLMEQLIKADRMVFE